MTAEHLEGHLGKGLIYEDTVPLSYSLIEADMVSGITPSEAARNLGVLRNLWMMQESLHDVPEEFSALEPALLRMESKLDLVVELLGQFLSETLQLPDAHPIRISSQFMQWQGREAVDVGTPILLKCYLLPHLPLPLTLRGSVSAMERRGEGYQLTMSLEELDEQCSELLDKIIFRNHRRSIARNRQSQ